MNYSMYYYDTYITAGDLSAVQFFTLCCWLRQLVVSATGAMPTQQ